MSQCYGYRLSGPVLVKAIWFKCLVVWHWSGGLWTALSSINKGLIAIIGQVVRNLRGAYWMIKQVRARILYIFSLAASLLDASEYKNLFTSGRCALCHMQRGVAGEVLAALVLAMCASLPLSFLAVHSHG